ncbi:TPA: hypothetical protein ACHJYJ_001915 [Enterococcus faecalis]|uniref:hypothetical protein n=1 Tax=Enterococcus sp. DIV0086 TaxID=2774655 RepID=UPI00374B814A
MGKQYFTAHEVIKQVHGLRSLSTLNKWANFIQKECDYTFQYEYIPFVSHGRKGQTKHHRKTRVFSTEEIQKLQEVAHLIPKIGRNKALRQLFDVHEKVDLMKHHELIDFITEILNEKLRERDKIIHALVRQYHDLDKRIIDLSHRVKQIEKTSAPYSDNTSSGWFRRKR